MSITVTREAQECFPLDQGVVIDLDTLFAAEWSLLHRDHLGQARTETFGAIEEFAGRLAGVSAELRRTQSPSIAAVAGGVNVAFIALLCIVPSWPDADFARDFLVGMSAVGQLESFGIFRDREQETCMTLAVSCGRGSSH